MNDADDAAPKILDLPIGLDVTGTRREFDSLGNVDVPADRYWERRPSAAWSISTSATTACRRRYITPTGT
jgi:fumarate hydratase class II